MSLSETSPGADTMPSGEQLSFRMAEIYFLTGGNTEVPMSDPLRKRAFERAAEILGGDERLAAYLRADMEEIDRWKDQSAPPPERVLQLLSRVLRDELVRKSKRASRRG